MRKRSVLRRYSMWIAGIVIVLTIGALATAQTISPLLVGTNVWYRPGQAQWESIAPIGVKIVRMGGHAYDKNMPSDSQFMTWIAEIKKLGAEPLIQVSQYGEERAANAVRLVKLFNVENPKYYVKYWGVGNEPWLQAGKPGFDSIVSKIEAYYKEIVPGMKAVDPKIKIFGPNMCYYEKEVYDALFGGANDISGKISGENYYYTDGLAWHRYVGGDLAHNGLDDFRRAIEACKARVEFASKLHNRTGDNVLGWGIGEFNANAGGGGTCSFAAGQMFAGIYMYCMQHEATFTTNWSIKEGGSSCRGTDFGILNGDNSPRSTAAHMQMVISNMSGIYCPGESSNDEVLVFGSRDDSRVCVMIINRSEEKMDYVMRLKGEPFTSDKLALNVSADVDSGHSGQINGSESQMIIFDIVGTPLERWTYNSTMDGKWAERQGL